MCILAFLSSFSRSRILRFYSFIMANFGSMFFVGIFEIYEARLA